MEAPLDAHDRVVRGHTRIKICGLTREEDIVAIRPLRPDFAGFIFADSRRRVMPETARDLIAGLGPDILPVGVFVDETMERIVEIAVVSGLRVVQLHGAENPAYLSALRMRLPATVAIWKALRMKGPEMLGWLQTMAYTAERSSPIDRFLLDAWHPDQSGGAGETFDWRMLAGVREPYLLAGGLTQENAGKAIHGLRPWGLDVSSGVETEGRKDPEKMAAFVHAVRQADGTEMLHTDKE